MAIPAHRSGTSASDSRKIATRVADWKALCWHGRRVTTTCYGSLFDGNRTKPYQGWALDLQCGLVRNASHNLLIELITLLGVLLETSSATP